VTSDELINPRNLAIRARLNGVLMQESSTANMIFPVAELVSYLSRHFTLEPGDLIMTGTPSGVGVFREPPIFMQDGDLIEIEIEGIGLLQNRCRITG
jgi:2-keto-4-pentenoate hydratase/2-oxohepta-3-ene-1,7-dioic acid hydratase in catechol pathway